MRTTSSCRCCWLPTRRRLRLARGQAALDIFADKLGWFEELDSHQQLVKPGLALNASASFECSELNCNLQLMLQPNPVAKPHPLQVGWPEQ